MKILFTAFEAFGNNNINPSWEAVQTLPDTLNIQNPSMKQVHIVKACLPVDFLKSRSCLEFLVKQETPDVVFCVGLARGRSNISLERVAINIMDANIPDNVNYQPKDIPICKNGKTAYFSNLPLKIMLHELLQNEIPGKISNSAGTYVCNTIMYHLMWLIDHYYPSMQGGFIHIPYSSSLAAQTTEDIASLPLLTIKEALIILTKTVCNIHTF